jgi:cytochrome c oxidase assembly factor CtaG
MWNDVVLVGAVGSHVASFGHHMFAYHMFPA